MCGHGDGPGWRRVRGCGPCWVRGLAAVAWTVVANGARARATAARTTSRQAAYQHALAAGFDRAFLVAAGIALLILLVAIAAIRVRRADLSGS